MITHSDLYQLGYRIKPENENMHDGSTDYFFPDQDKRPYLVNLSKRGNVTIIYPVNKQQRPFSTSEIRSFADWHNRYQNSGK